MDLKVLEIVAFLVHQIADLDLDSRQILIRWVDLIHLPGIHLLPACQVEKAGSPVLENGGTSLVFWVPLLVIVYLPYLDFQDLVNLDFGNL